jgi:hypothetical protein
VFDKQFPGGAIARQHGDHAFRQFDLVEDLA